MMATTTQIGRPAGINKIVLSVLKESFDRQECISLGGDLVSIHSARENGLVYGLMNAGQDVRPAWIGVAVCNDTSGCNEFSWTDGSPVPYSNFQSGKNS